MSEPVNILLFTVDDMNADTPGVFGGPPDVTPTVDRLAAEGMMFRRAHVPVAICLPSRSAMLTGLYPHHNGAQGFVPERCEIDEGVPVLTHLLRPLGYRCGILGKVTHLLPVERFGWDLALDQPELGQGRNPAMYAEAAAAFFAAAAADGRPWFLMANAHDPHRPFNDSPEEHEHFGDDLRAQFPAPSRIFEPGSWPVPGFLPDLPDVRTEIAQYLSSSRRADDVLAAVLGALDESGQAENTLVIFLSDNGMAFPFAKENCYLHSTRTPLVVRWPDAIDPGRVDTEHYINGVDLLPTICELVGAVPPDRCDGRSFVPLLLGRTQTGRSSIATVYQENFIGLPYNMRCVQDRTAGYIWNAWSDGSPSYAVENMVVGLTWRAIKLAAATDPEVAARASFYERRVPEELYDFESDPDALNNLVSDPRAAHLLRAKRHELADWLEAIEDPLADTYRATVLAGATTSPGDNGEPDLKGPSDG